MKKSVHKPNYFEASTNLLSQSGLKQTPFRKALIETLARVQSPLSAAQILEHLIKNKKGVRNKIKFDRATLFRNLKELTQKNVLNSTEFGTGALYYELKKTDHAQHHAYCVRCKKTLTLKKCSALPMIQEAQQLGFQIFSHKMELLGFCASCA